MNEDIALFVLRVVIGAVVLAHGLIKIGWPISTGQRGMPAVRGVAGYFDSLGFWPPMFWALVTILAEVGGSLLTILGLGGPIGPGLIFGDMLIVTIVAHWPQGFWVRGEKAGIEFPLPIAAGALAIALLGNGGWSLDALFGLTYPDFWIMVWLVVMLAGDVALLAIRAGRRREA
jgi:putative oxidoreductase